MDSLTHIFLGGTLAMAIAGRRAGYRRTFLLGSLAATLPDADVFLHTGDALQDHALHRHFMHALILVPLLAALALLPFLFSKKSRPLAKPLYLAALLACASHTLLDSLTSYGTMIFWPFTDHRFTLDIIAVVDPAYTLPLILGTILAWHWRSARPALAALLLSTLYLGFATLQHARALETQRQLLASRGHSDAANPRVLPQVGAVISYRSIYVHHGQIHIDAIREPFLAAPRLKPGGTLPLVEFASLQNALLPAQAAHDFATFSTLSDGFIARSPTNPLLIGDARYAYTPEGLEPVWGMQLEQTPAPQFSIIPRHKYILTLARDLFHPSGYSRIPPASIPPPTPPRSKPPLPPHP